jgi:hypothetical protein
MDWFSHSPTPEMELFRNVNIGPSIAMPVIAKTHPVTIIIDCNYRFGNVKPVTP